MSFRIMLHTVKNLHRLPMFRALRHHRHVVRALGIDALWPLRRRQRQGGGTGVKHLILETGRLEL